MWGTNPLGSCDGAGLWEWPTRAPVPPTGLVLEHHLPGGEGEEQGLESLPSPREHSAPRRRVRPRGLGQAEGSWPVSTGCRGKRQEWKAKLVFQAREEHLSHCLWPKGSHTVATWWA